MRQLYDLEGLETLFREAEIAVVYFSTEGCSVCKTLKPKIAEVMKMQFPKAVLAYVDAERSPVVAGQYRVFAAPTIDIYVQGKQHARFSRSVSLLEFEEAIWKPYSMLFD